ncbi:hypothetical protein C6501_18080 [Candidatus Poribacteria bacterium]|nr:MAG: hypothetical protein C6501_18080 [Candidatus Poribacteria bacterium]
MKKGHIFIFTLLIINTIFLSGTFAEDYTRWKLPEGAKLRLGKGKIGIYRENHPCKFSPDNTQLAVFSSLGIWIYDVQTGKELRLLTGHKDNINSITYSPVDQTLASASSDKTIRLWDTHTGALKAILIGHTSTVTSVSFSPDGQMLASGSSDGTIRLWNPVTWESKSISTEHNYGNGIIVVFSPDGRTLASKSGYQIYLWDTGTRKLIMGLQDMYWAAPVVFSPDGQTFTSSSRKGIHLWHTDTGKLRHILSGRSDVDRYCIRFSPDGTTLASHYWRNTVLLWDVATGELKATLAGNWGNRIGSIAFSPDGRILASSSYSEIDLWDAATGKQKTTLMGEGSFNQLMFSPNGQILATINISGIKLWDINTKNFQDPELRCTITGYTPRVHSIAFSPDGKTLASGYERENIRLWDVSSGNVKQVFTGHPYQLSVQSVAFSPNGKTLASLSISTQSSDSKAEILLWDVDTGKYRMTLKGHGKDIGEGSSCHSSSVAFSPDGKTLVSGSSDGTVRLWNIKTPKESSFEKLRGVFSGYRKGVLKGHTDQVRSVAISPDGNTIASASFDKIIRLWDTRTHELKASFNRHRKEVNCVIFSPDGRTLASADVSGTIFLWDPTTTNLKTIFVADQEVNRSVMSLAFSLDGKTLASGGWNIHLWDINKHQLKTMFTGHRGLVNSVKFSPDGKTLASGSADGTVLIWELDQ